MSSQLISSHPFAPSPQPPPTIMVGKTHIEHELSQLFHKTHADAFSSVDCIRSSQTFGRDSRVVGLNHIHIIPHATSPANKLIWALLPRSSLHFIENDRTGVGRGFNKENVKGALSAVQKYNLPYRQALSSIEGGNCYVFFGPGGRPSAIVGMNSIAPTLHGLEEQGYFEKEENQEKLNNLLVQIDTPSDDAIYRARNMELFAALSNGILEKAAYIQRVMLSLSEENRARYFRKAFEWEAKERMVMLVIADDLGVPLRNIAFVPQTEFHIDMDMLVAPDGLTVYLDVASSKPSTISTVQEELERIGCHVILVQGAHTSYKVTLEQGVRTVAKKSINFMNGIFVSTPTGPLYITNGIDPSSPKERALRQAFKNQMAFESAFINAAQDILTRNHGGIHCLTWEKPYYATPLDIVISYLADMPVPEKKLREHMGEVLAVLDASREQPQEEQPIASGEKRKLHVDADAHASSSNPKGRTNQKTQKR